MANIEVAVTETVAARPEDVYALLADYHGSHAAILPKPEFAEFEVLEGGQGAGTRFRLKVVVMGVAREFHMSVTEPEKGRVLQESSAETGQVTTFTIDPINDGEQTKLTIATSIPPSAGIAGLIDRLFTPSTTRRLFKKEFENIHAYVASYRMQAS